MRQVPANAIESIISFQSNINRKVTFMTNLSFFFFYKLTWIALKVTFFIVHALFKADFFGLEKIQIDSVEMATYTLSFTHFDKSMSLCTLLARDTTPHCADQRDRSR